MVSQDLQEVQLLGGQRGPDHEICQGLLHRGAVKTDERADIEAQLFLRGTLQIFGGAEAALKKNPLQLVKVQSRQLLIPAQALDRGMVQPLPAKIGEFSCSRTIA